MITHVAIKDSSGKIWSLPKPNRHHDVIRSICAESKDRPDAMNKLNNHTQGFLTHDGYFLDRVSAYREAVAHRQLLKPPETELFSEDVW